MNQDEARYRGHAGGIAQAASMTSAERREVAQKGAAARWGHKRRLIQQRCDVLPCLVYVNGPQGMNPQIWYEPMVNEFGKPMVKPEGIILFGDPVQLPDHGPWTVERAEAVVLRARKNAKNAA